MITKRTLIAVPLLAALLAATCLRQHSPAWAETVIADDALVLEYKSAPLRQQVVVSERSAFMVSSTVGQLRWEVSGKAGAIVDGFITIDFRVERKMYESESRAVFAVPLKVNGMPGRSCGSGGSMIGGAILDEIWIRRGRDPVPYVKQALASREVEVFFAATRYLSQLGPKAEAAIPALIEALDAENEQIRRAAIVSLGRLGRKARAAAPILRKALDDPAPEVRAEAAKALQRIENDGDVPEGLPLNPHQPRELEE